LKHLLGVDQRTRVLTRLPSAAGQDAGLLTDGVKMMPFPPNYRLDKSNRARTKAQKALEKQQKREEKSARRKQGHEDTAAEDRVDNEQDRRGT
jgi:hypothetical protein